MKRMLKLVAALAVLVVMPMAVQASDPVMTGGIALEGPGEGSLIQMQSESPIAFRGRVINVYRKYGNQDSTEPYSFRGQMRVQTDPRTIEAVLSRSVRLICDEPEMRLAEIEDSVDKLFQDLGTTASGLSLGEKLSVLIDMSETELTLRDNLLFYAKQYPSIGVAAGIAFIDEIDILSTYELRLCPEGKDAFNDGVQVIGRVSVHPRVPYIAPAPGQPHVVRVMDERGELNVRLRWAAAPGISQTGPLTFGYNIYRIPANLADGDWETTPPTREELESVLGLEAGTLDDSVYRVNRLAVLPPRELTEEEADTTILDNLISQRYAVPSNWSGLAFADIDEPEERIETVDVAPSSREDRISLESQIKEQQSLFCYIDDNDRWFGGESFTKGDAFYYTIAVRNTFGTGGELSPFTKVGVSSLDALPAPTGVKVVNEFSYDPSTSLRQQQLVLKWDALRDEETGKVREDVSYFVYRWNTATEMLSYARQPFATGIRTEFVDEAAYFGSEAPVYSGLIGGPADLDQPDEEGVCRFADGGITGVYEGITFFYTVRAVIGDGSLPEAYPVFSPHSVPAWGVLRDREGPKPATDLHIMIPCVSVDVQCESSSIQPAAELDGFSISPDSHLLRVSCVPDEDPGLAMSLKTAFFRCEIDGEARSLGSVDFEDGQAAVVELEVEQMSSLSVSCCVLLDNGKLSGWVDCLVNVGKPDSSSLIDASFSADVIQQIVENGSGCGSYYPYDPDGSFNPPVMSFIPGEDTYGYHIFRRVDDGAEDLILTDEQDDDGEAYALGDPITHADPHIPANVSRICYYFQPFDEHGNPGEMQEIDCLDVAMGRLELPVPTLTKVMPLGTVDAPQFLVSWFCPPSGVERFEVLISSADSGEAVGGMVGAGLTNRLEMPEEETIEDENYARYITVRVDAFEEGVALSEAHPSVVDSGLFSILLTEGVSTNSPLLIRIRSLGPTVQEDQGPMNVSSDYSEVLSGIWRNEVVTEVGEHGPDVSWPERAISRARFCPVPGIKPVVIDTMDLGAWANFEGVGIRIGQIPSDAKIDCEYSGEAFNGKQAPVFTLHKSYELSDILINLETYGRGDKSILPCLVYRMEVDPDSADESNNFTPQPVSGDLIQCSPVFKSTNIAYDPFVAEDLPRAFREPFLFIAPLESGAFSDYYPIYIIDTQPVIRGSTYQYFLSILSERGEIETIWKLKTIEIPE